jgi:polysaccharide export outer membrane protein
MRKQLVLMALTAVLICGCETPNVAYFGDLTNGKSVTTSTSKEIRFHTGDKLSIVVSSRDPQLSALFNLPNVTQRIGMATTSSNVSGNSNGIMCYTIDSKGEIDFPVLGKLHIAGMNREEVCTMVKHELTSRDLVKDPIVTVEYAGLFFNVLGEVGRPGRYNFDRDRFTLLDALSMAGDLTIQGKRDNVAVMRMEGDHRTTYRVNLQSGEEVYNSPVYYLQQDDIIYVEPTEKRANESTQNNNLLQTPTFWMSVTTFLMSLGVLIFK